MPPIVFISLESWDEIWRRNQFICAELARRDPTRRILFFGPPFDFTYALRSGDWQPAKRRTPHALSGFPNIQLHPTLKAAPNSTAVGRWINQRLMRAVISATLRREGVRSPLLWINDHSAEHLVGHLGEIGTIYDITDDWTTFEQDSQLMDRTRHQDESLCRKATQVIVCSELLLELKRPLVADDRLNLISNGVHTEHYRRVMESLPALSEVASAWPQPVFGYTGTVHPERVDVPLVEEMARGMSRGSLVFVGPDHLPARDRERLLAAGRVILHGPVPYARLPELMQAFAACIVPHRLSAFTESLNPIKLWEYLAAGKPIVATPVAGFRDFPKLVRLASTPAAFLQEMDAALEEPAELSDLRRAEAAQHSWSRRVDAVEAVLRRAVHAHCTTSPEVAAV